MNARNKRARGQRVNRIIRNTIIYIILTIMAVFWLIPFVYLIAQSFAKTYVQYQFFPLPNELTLANYAKLFTTQFPFWRWWINTFLIAALTSVIKTCLVLMCSYALSRLRFKSRKSLMKLILVLGMFPGFIGMVVTYQLLKLMGLVGGASAIFGIMLLYVAGSIMDYYIAKGFFDTISKSLDEAAMIDGASKNTIFWKIILPLSKPIVVYTLLMAFTGPWGDFMTVSYLVEGNKDAFNVAVGLKNIIDNKETAQEQFTIFCAGGVLTSLPIIVLFFALQKYYVQGITGGAVKG